ncbi:MAG: radical SAM protein [candidate division FCPU426 bacterium]
MKVLFVHCNINTGNGPHFVPGVASISAVLKQAGHTTRLIFVQKPMEAQDFLGRVEAEAPDIVGFSVVSNQWNQSRHYTRLIRERFPQLPVIHGGVHITVAAEEALACPEISLLCVGEGEHAMLELLERLQAGRPYADIRNLWIKTPAGEIIRNPLRPLIQDLDSLPLMDRDLFDFPIIYKKNSMDANILMVGRGCPFLCTYCVNHTLQKQVFKGLGKYVRMRSPERAIEELLDMKARYDIDWINIYDDTLTYDHGWLKKFCGLYREKVRLPFWCNIRLDTVTPAILKMLRETGCTLLVAGIESGSERVRYQVLNRRMSNKKILDTYRLIDELGFKTKAYFILGFPGETLAEMDETLEIHRQIKPNHSQLSIFYPYPHTALYEQAKKMGYLTEQQNNSFFEATSLALPEEIREAMPAKVARFRDDAFQIKLTKEGRGSRFDFLRELPGALVKAGGDQYVATTFANITYHERIVIFAHPESSIQYEVDLPAQAWLKFALGISPEVWSPEKGTGVHFEITVQDETGEHLVFSQYLDPKNNAEDRRWVNVRLDLPQFKPGRKKITFITTTKGQSNNFCWSMWDHPLLMSDEKAVD